MALSIFRRAVNSGRASTAKRYEPSYPFFSRLFPVFRPAATLLRPVFGVPSPLFFRPMTSIRLVNRSTGMCRGLVIFLAIIGNNSFYRYVLRFSHYNYSTGYVRRWGESGGMVGCYGRILGRILGRESGGVFGGESGGVFGGDKN